MAGAKRPAPTVLSVYWTWSSLHLWATVMLRVPMSIDAGSPHGLASSGSPRPTVVLACSGPEAGAMVEVARALIADGVRVDVVAGVDLDARPIELALEQHFGSTLWVLCRSEHLDEYQLELLLLTVRASEVAEEHVIALPYDPDATTTFVGLVRRRLVALAWIAGEPGVPTPRRAEPTPVPALAPEASGFADVQAPASSRRRIGAALALIACVGMGAWWWSGTSAAAADARVSAVASLADVATPDVRDAAPAEVSDADPDADRGPRIDRPRAPEHAPLAPTVASTIPAPARHAFELTGPIGRALAERRIRALDALLVSSPRPSATARRARKQCGKLRDAGVRAWRLPVPEELDALAEAGFLPDEARYWARRGKASRRADVEGDSVRTRKVSRKGKANVLCVAVAPAKT
jgi:hypothetical protein